MNEKEAAVSSLTSLLVSYTSQLEEYERACGTFTLSILSAIAAVVTITVTVCSVWDASIWVIIAMCLVIPGLELIYLFVFSHYTRRVTFYRGYCVYIEKRLNELTGRRDYFFHKEVMDKTMSVFGMSAPLMYIGFAVPYLSCLSIGTYVIIVNINNAFLIGLFALFLVIGIGLANFVRVLTYNKKVADEMIYLA